MYFRKTAVFVRLSESILKRVFKKVLEKSCRVLAKLKKPLGVNRSVLRPPHEFCKFRKSWAYILKFYEWLLGFFILWRIGWICNHVHNILRLFVGSAQIFLSPQVKWSMIIRNKLAGTYELPQKLSNNLRLRIIGN